jgi:hypothetical protein
MKLSPQTSSFRLLQPIQQTTPISLGGEKAQLLVRFFNCPNSFEVIRFLDEFLCNLQLMKQTRMDLVTRWASQIVLVKALSQEKKQTFTDICLSNRSKNTGISVMLNWWNPLPGGWSYTRNIKSKVTLQQLVFQICHAKLG